MAEVGNFGEVLRALMKQKRFSMAVVTEMIGARSKTEVVRVLGETCSDKKRAEVYHQLELSGAFDDGELAQLSDALVVSRLGKADYRSMSTVRGLLSGRDETAADVRLDEGDTLREALRAFLPADSLDILCVNARYLSVSTAIRELVQHYSGALTLRHIIRTDDNDVTAAETVTALLPTLSDLRSRLLGVSFAEQGPRARRFSADLLLIRATLSGQSREGFFAFSSDVSGTRLPCASGMTASFERELERMEPPPAELKDNVPIDPDKPFTPQFVSHLVKWESNRELVFFRPTLGVEWLSPEFLRDELMPMAAPDADAQYRRRIYELTVRRRNNLLQKRKPTTMVMMKDDLLDTMRTGLLSNHPDNLPRLPVENREQPIRALLECARTNPRFHLRILDTAGFQPARSICIYGRNRVMIHGVDRFPDRTMGSFRFLCLTYPQLMSELDRLITPEFLTAHSLSEEACAAFLESMLQPKG